MPEKKVKRSEILHNVSQPGNTEGLGCRDRGVKRGAHRPLIGPEPVFVIPQDSACRAVDRPLRSVDVSTLDIVPNIHTMNMIEYGDGYKILNLKFKLGYNNFCMSQNLCINFCEDRSIKIALTLIADSEIRIQRLWHKNKFVSNHFSDIVLHLCAIKGFDYK
ncbi:hypothetical protein FF38_01651 [Lucilia cuprina]|uniref:Uncharacterized protein n=1 Tax=Lucilia cuprina TaxID=7375 RepID=A0A0L0BX17_LUCCU|nr:hypothetical protein FF38_01651 [Lucilia cuprina]